MQFVVIFFSSLTFLHSEQDRKTQNTRKWQKCFPPPFFFTSLLVHVYLLCSHHLLATVYESKGEFRSALQHEEEAYSIYNNQVCFKSIGIACLLVLCLSYKLRNFFVSHMKVGEDHESMKESSEYLKSLTQQAVVLQKAINHIYSNTSSACTPPPKVCTLL